MIIKNTRTGEDILPPVHSFLQKLYCFSIDNTNGIVASIGDVYRSDSRKVILKEMVEFPDLEELQM